MKQSKRFFKHSSVSTSILAMFTCAVLLTGCSKGYDTDTNTVFVEENGKIVSVDIETFDKNDYSEKDLKSYIQESIDSYNAKNADSVKKKKLSVKNNVATLVLEFADDKVYQEFSGTELFQGTIAEAKEEGYAFDTEFVKFSNGKVSPCEAKEILDKEELNVVIIKSNTNVQVNGEILYVSAQNIAEVGTNRVSIKEGSHISDLEVYGTENIEGTEEVEGTETTEDEGSVGEDELLIEAEEIEMKFDFSDSEQAGSSSQLSEVYTYIVYKTLK